MEQVIRRIYETGTVIGRSGKVHKLKGAIGPTKGKFIQKIIYNDPAIVKTLEVGCGYGLSSLHICLSIRERAGAYHIIIDPYQNSRWDGVGIRNLEEANIEFFDLIEVKSEFALPRLLEEKEGQLDFIFIDGWHTFDHTLLDCFYASRLLRVRGVLVIDDVNMPSVNRVVRYLNNYPCYEEYGSVKSKLPASWEKVVARALTFPIKRKTWAKVLAPSLFWNFFCERKTMVALKKIKKDNRKWNWHADDF